MLDIGSYAKEVKGFHFSEVPTSMYEQNEPLVLKGLVNEWPAVQQANTSDENIVDYLKSFYSGKEVVLYHAPNEKQGRFFYNEDFSKLDFNASRSQFDLVLNKLLEAKTEAAPDTYYVGSTTVDVCLPGFRAANDLATPGINPLVSIWVGNHSRVAAHFDGPDNIACCVAGKRRFTMFPPDQIENLYVGPIDFTPSGQVISCVDFKAPDFDKFPKFQEALKHSVVADLEPGDALVLPSMWWHHVESFSSFNILVNYWYRNVPRYMEPPVNVLHHAMMSLRDLPEREKQAWKALFDFYIFDSKPNQFSHMPHKARGFLNPMDENLARRLRSWLLNKLNR